MCRHASPSSPATATPAATASPVLRGLAPGRSAARGTQLTGGISGEISGAEAARRMLINTLESQVAEERVELVVYGGSGDIAREWPSDSVIVATLRRPEADGGLLVSDEFAAAVARVTAPLTA